MWGCGLQRTWLLALLDAAEVRDQVVPLFPCLLPYLAGLAGGTAKVLVN